MGITRKMISICTMGLIKFRSVREQNARTARLAQQEDARMGRAVRRDMRRGGGAPLR